MGVLALLPPILGAFAASSWTPAWSTLAYYATCMPPIFGYSVFLCVQLVALVGAVDSQAMVSPLFPASALPEANDCCMIRPQ